MIDDLLRRYNFVGWARTDLVALLGKPDAVPGNVGFASWDMAYYLGMERGGAFSLDDEFLLFRIDSHGNVREYRVGVN
jgi:hypothetical protein